MRTPIDPDPAICDTPDRRGAQQEVLPAMFRLDYLSCFLTILATILVGRKLWTGLVVSGVNSLIVCVIGVQTSQFGFIPANLFCICIYACSIRSWLKERTQSTKNATPEASTESAVNPQRKCSTAQRCIHRLIQPWKDRFPVARRSSFVASVEAQ